MIQSLNKDCKTQKTHFEVQVHTKYNSIQTVLTGNTSFLFKRHLALNWYQQKPIIPIPKPVLFKALKTNVTGLVDQMAELIVSNFLSSKGLTGSVVFKLI